MDTRAVTEASLNGAKIRKLLTDDVPWTHADLYRTHTTGTASGRLHMNIHVGRIRYLPDGPDEFAIINHRDGQVVGYARRVPHDGTLMWSCTEDNEFDGLVWRGYFDRLSAGVDKVVNG